jgi:hypothetical protein
VLLRTTIAGLALAVCLPATAAAQDFGVLNSAETINRGNFKFIANPIVFFGRDGADDEVGVAVSGGYGFTERFDVEGRLGFFDELTFIGADAEYWLVRNQPLDVSFIAGLHRGVSDSLFDTTGVDFTFLASGHATPRLELYGALDFSVNDYDEDAFDGYTTAHLVPGFEFALGPDIDFVGEVGIGLNDDSWHYLTAGLAFYVR